MNPFKSKATHAYELLLRSNREVVSNPKFENADNRLIFTDFDCSACVYNPDLLHVRQMKKPWRLKGSALFPSLKFVNSGLIVTDNLRICDGPVVKPSSGTAMRIRELHEIRYEGKNGNLKLSGLNPYKEAKSVNVAIDNPEEFLNAIKTALTDSEARPIKVGRAK